MTTLGFSPCPNDTYIFYALMNGRIDSRGLRFEPRIEDVETLNQLAIARELDITKVSCNTFLHVQQDYTFLSSGGAFGRGCGPLIVTRCTLDPKELKGKTIAIPGEMTTAYLLLKLFHKSEFGCLPENIVPMVFSEIPSAVRDGRVDAGLIIHESRFTYKQLGLSCLLDMGDWWERETGLPIPLGGIIAKKSLADTVSITESLIRESIEYANSNRAEAMPYIRAHSQELEESVINSHIGLYVNEYSLDMGIEGRAALAELRRRAGSEF